MTARKDVMKIIHKIFGNMLFVACMVFMLWFTFSFAEIAYKNTFDNPEYNKYNCFIITKEVLENENVND